MGVLIGKVSLKKLSIQPLFYIRLILDWNLRRCSYNSLNWFISCLPCKIDFWHLFRYPGKYKVETLIYLWIETGNIFFDIWQRSVLIHKIFRDILNLRMFRNIASFIGTQPVPWERTWTLYIIRAQIYRNRLIDWWTWKQGWIWRVPVGELPWMRKESGSVGQNKQVRMDVKCGRSTRYRMKLCFNTLKPRRLSVLMGFEKKRAEIKTKA